MCLFLLMSLEIMMNAAALAFVVAGFALIVAIQLLSLGLLSLQKKRNYAQLFYLMSRGLSQEQAMSMVVNGFIEPITRTLPMEYAVEWSRLIELQMEGSIG